MNDLDIVSTGVYHYYRTTDYTTVDLTKVQKSGHIPKAQNLARLGSKSLAIGDTTADTFKFDVADMDYELCVISGNESVAQLLEISYGASTSQVVYASADLPVYDKTKIAAFETFCDGATGQTVSYKFER